jgi:hypothetical protein
LRLRFRGSEVSLKVARIRVKVCRNSTHVSVNDIPPRIRVGSLGGISSGHMKTTQSNGVGEFGGEMLVERLGLTVSWIIVVGSVIASSSQAEFR